MTEFESEPCELEGVADIGLGRWLEADVFSDCKIFEI